MNTMVVQRIDDWNILVKVIPGVKEVFLNTVLDLTGERYLPCIGDCETRGYREGTRWLHCFGLSSQVFAEVEANIKKLSDKYSAEIKNEKQARADKPSMFR